MSSVSNPAFTGENEFNPARDIPQVGANPRQCATPLVTHSDGRSYCEYSVVPRDPNFTGAALAGVVVLIAILVLLRKSWGMADA